MNFVFEAIAGAFVIGAIAGYVAARSRAFVSASAWLKAEYDRGYTDGARAMRAVHVAVFGRSVEVKDDELVRLALAGAAGTPVRGGVVRGDDVPPARGGRAAAGDRTPGGVTH